LLYLLTYSLVCECLKARGCDVCLRLSARGLTYNNNSGQLSIEYLRPDSKSQFSKRSYPTIDQLRQHVAAQVARETNLPIDPTCSNQCPYPKPDPSPDFTGALVYVYNDIAKVTTSRLIHSIHSVSIEPTVNSELMNK